MGTPGVFLLKAAPGREEGNLSYKCGGGGLLVRGVEPIKRGAEDKEKGTFQEREGQRKGWGSILQ